MQLFKLCATKHTVYPKCCMYVGNVISLLFYHELDNYYLWMGKTLPSAYSFMSLTPFNFYIFSEWTVFAVPQIIKLTLNSFIKTLSLSLR